MKNKITIGLFVDSFFPMVDGVATVVDNYAKRLSEKTNVIVFAPKYKQEYDDDKLSYKVVRCRSIKIPFIDYVLPLPDRKFKKKLNTYKLDVVHIHSPATLGLLGIKYAKKEGCFLVGTMHSQYKQDFQRAIKSKWLINFLTKKTTDLYNKCDECFAVNNEVARIFHEEYGYKKMPKVIKNATDMKLINKTDKIDKMYDIKKDEKVFLFVGRINKLKNIFFIADALEKLNSKNINFKYKMLFVGTGQDEKELKKYIENKNLNNVIMCGKITDKNLLAEYYARADLFLFPSVYDCSSIVQIEAASQKTPSLLLKNTATADTVTDNVNGYLSDNNEEAYAGRIIEIMNNEKQYKEVCENAYRDIYITWDEIVDQIYKIYLKKAR